MNKLNTLKAELKKSVIDRYWSRQIELLVKRLELGMFIRFILPVKVNGKLKFFFHFSYW